MTGVNNNKQVNQVDLNQFKIGARINQQDSDVKKSIFNQIDKDGDGVIEKGEYEGVVTAKFKGKDGKPVERQMIKLKSLEKGRSLCVDQNGKQWVVAHDGTVLNDKYVENPEQFKADAKYQQQVQTRKAADKHAQNFYGIADDNSGGWGDSVVKMKNYWDKNVNSKNVLQMLDSYQSYLEKEEKSDSSIIDTITSETGASAAEQRVMLTSILQTLCKAAREAGVSEGDINKARKDFNTSMNTELNAHGRRTNPKDMEKAIDFLRGAIIAKQNAGGEITEKQAIETVAKDFSEQNTKAQKEYKDAREEDGWAASVGDTVCGWFGCTTVEDMDKKLGANAKAAKLLATAKTEEEFKVRYKQVFGIEFDKNKIAARDVALGKYQQANAMDATIKVTDGILANSESKNYATLRAEIKEKFQINDEVADTIIANYGAVTGKEVKTEADKREMLLHFLKETKSASQSEYQTLTNGKTLEQMGKDLELLHKSAFGTSDIAKDVAQFNENMVVTEMVAESVFEVAGTIALQFVPGLGQMAAAKLAVSAAKWGTKAVKVANAAAKAEKAFAAVAKFQQGAGMTSKIASKAAKVGSSMATTGVATATVGLTNGDDAKAVMRKTLMNMSFAGVGVGANELAPKLMSAFGVNKAIANELAEEIINAAGSYGITKIAGDDYGSSDAFIDLATGMALARLGHIKGGAPDVNAPKPASAKPQVEVEAKPQVDVKPEVDVASVPRRENQVSMRVDRSNTTSSNNVVSTREWTKAGVDANGNEISVRQNSAGSIIVDRAGSKNLVRFAEGQTRIELGQDANGVNLILTKSPSGEVRLSKLDSNSRANRLDTRTNPEPRKSSLDTETKPTPVTEKPASTKPSSRYLDKPIENENLANLAKKRYPNASDELKGRLLDIDAAISTIDDPYILDQINKMQDIDDIERLADIMNELNGNYSAYQRVLKYQDGKYLVKSNAAEFSTITRELDATGHKAFMDGEDVSSLSGNDNVKGLRDDLAEETRLYSMKEYLKDNSRRSEISDYLYNKYYLDGLDVSPATKARMQEIANTYNTRIFLGQDTQNVDQVLDKLEDEFRKFEQASNYQCKFPPVVDFNRIKESYFKRVPGSAFSEGRTGSLGFSHMDIQELEASLRHELIHSNDKFLKKGIDISADEFPEVFPQNPKIDPETGDYIIDLNECKYADEFRKAGIDDWVIEYAHTDPREFVAVAAEGDMSKYSLELQNVLKKMGMPDWAFNLPAPVKNIDVSSNVGPVHVGKISDHKISASPFRRFKEMFGGSSTGVNLSKNYDLSISRARNDYPNEGLVRSEQHQRALGSSDPTTVRTLDPSVNPRNIAQHVENGGVCSINGKLYANSNGKAVELKMSQQTFERLFPEKGFAAIKQQGRMNCWLVSSLNAMGDVPAGRVKLYSMIEELPNGAIKVQLPGQTSLTFPDGNPLVAHEIQLGVGAAPGVEMIEQAVLAKHVQGISADATISSLDVSTLIDEANRLKNTQFKAFSMLHGKGTTKTFKANLNETTSDFKVRLQDYFENEYRTGDFVGANWRAHARHITNYDPNTQMITIHDPYYDGVDVQMSLDKFAQKYPSLTIAKSGVDSGISKSPEIQVPRQETSVQPSRSQRSESANLPEQRQQHDVSTINRAQSSVATNPQAPRKFMLASMEKEVGTVNGQPIKARLVARSTSGIATVEVGGKTYDILPNEKTKIAPGIELECDSRGLVKVINTQSATPVQPKPQVSSQPAPEVKPQTKTTHNTRVSVEQKTTTIMNQWRTVATTADGLPIEAKVQGDVVIISKNGKETEIPIEKGESIPVRETSTDSYLIIKREGFRITITTSDTPELD
ncbi:hypothetical protein J6A64_05630 [bacterium]|nr:hypothetical protein [bacterium]